MPRAFFDLPAPAKLNLFLHVLGRRIDGMHLLQSVFVLIDWCDTLHVEVRADGRLRRHDLGTALPDDDLCLRAATALKVQSGCPLGADISIDKRVPWGAGLGGGSSDAATTLLALNRLWRLRWPRQRLMNLAAGIGADVPFFVGGRNAFVEGVGEQLTALELPPQTYLVLKPAQALVTADMFAHAALRRDSEPVILAGLIESARQTGLFCAASGALYGRNDLQPVAQDSCPDVLAAAEWLQGRFGNSRMSGSGSAVFARIDTGDAGNGAEATGFTQDARADWVVRRCRGLHHHPLLGWAD
jgi:4-diphosphocytidyl-2-C-methyl-D-erythritol kinase